MRSPGTAPIIDSDQHLFEYRGLWAEHIDPAVRDEALEARASVRKGGDPQAERQSARAKR